MLKFGLFLLCATAVAEASVRVVRGGRDGRHPTAMEVEVQLPQGTTARLPLKRTDAFESMPMTVVNGGVSRTFSSRQVHHPSFAHYQDVKSRSVMSVRHVAGRKQFSGHFMHEGKSYFVEPNERGHNVRENPIKAEHAMRQKAEEQLMKNVRKALSRKRRQLNSESTPFVVEVAVCVDSTVWSYFLGFAKNDATKALTELHYAYTHIMTGVDITFRNMGSPSVSVRGVSLTVSQSAGDDAWMPSASTPNRLEGSVILKSIAAYKAKLSPMPDHVMAFTRLDITGDGSTSVCGMAYMAAVCTNNGVSINEDQGLQSWGTAAHELGHNMGSQHDGSGTSCSSSNQNVMSPAAGFYDINNVANSYKFSACSVANINGLIQGLSGTGNCLASGNSMGAQSPELAKIRLEGVRLTLDQVCKLTYSDSHGFFLSDKAKSSPASICANIYCTTAEGGGTAMAGMRAPAGTPCGNKKSCNWKGQCTDDPEAPAADDSCFWGDLIGDQCTSWVSFLVQNPSYKSSYCSYVKPNCCKSIGTACD